MRSHFYVKDNNARWFKYDRDYVCVNKSQFVPVIFEPPCTLKSYVIGINFEILCIPAVLKFCHLPVKVILWDVLYYAI
jgi:hypothetical protein